MGRELALVCLLLAGCAHGASSGTTLLPSPTEAADASDWREAQDLLSARMRSVSEGLAATGYAPGPFAQRGFLATGARTTHELLAPAGRCLTVVALATAGMADLDAAIFEASGEAVSQDAASDARPVLRACARGGDRRLYYVLHAFRGNGAYLVVSFEGPMEGAGPRELGGADVGPATHTDWTAALVRRGFEPEGQPVELELSPDSQVRMALPARTGQCVALVAFAETGGVDVNLSLADEAGVDRVRDEASRPWAGVQLCPDASGVFTARVSIRGDAARVLVGRFAGRASHVGGERAMWLGDLVDAAAPPEQASAKAAYRPLPGASGNLAAGAVEERRVRVPPGRCAQLRAQLGDGLEQVHLRLVDRTGETLQATRLTAHDPGVHVCGAGGQRLAVQVEARRGVGDYALLMRPLDDAQLSSIPEMPAAALGRQLDLRALADKRGWPAPEGESVPPSALRCDGATGCVWTRTQAVPSGKCVSAVLLDGGGGRLPLAIRAPGLLEARARQGFTTRCAHGGEVQLRVELPARPAAPLHLLQVVHDAVK